MPSHRKRAIRLSLLASTAVCALAASPAEAGNGSVTFTYDAAGNRSSVVTTTGNTLGPPPSPAPPQPALPIGPPGSPPSGTGAVSYSYDALGRVATANYDNSVFIQYTYDAAGNRTQQVVTTGTP